MIEFRVAVVAVAAAVAGFVGTFLYQSHTEAMGVRQAKQLLRVADNNTPDGTETQDPEQQEQQAENQQLCGNPNGCG